MSEHIEYDSAGYPHKVKDEPGHTSVPPAPAKRVHPDSCLTYPEPAPPAPAAPQLDSKFSVQEEAAIAELSRSMDISRNAVLRQGLRILQAVQAGVVELRDTGKNKAAPAAPHDESPAGEWDERVTAMEKVKWQSSAPAPQETAEQLYKRFGGLTCSNKVIDDIYAAGATSRVQGLEERLRQIVTDLRAHKIQGPSNITGPVSEALIHVADRIEAALTEDSHGG